MPRRRDVAIRVLPRGELIGESLTTLPLFTVHCSLCTGEHGALGGEDFLEAGLGHVDEGVELGAGEAALFGGGLGLDEAAIFGHHNIHIDIGGGVLFVAEVEQGRAADDADRGGGDELLSGDCLRVPALTRALRARARATAAPVMAAVRVPPSAWMTSQSRMTVRSPRACMSTTERRLRPMSR